MSTTTTTRSRWIAFAFLSERVAAQTISSNMPLPPMEWIKLNPTGTTSPPALSHGCLMGPTYPDSTSSLPGFSQAFLFGGLSSAGTSSSGLYILDYSNDIPSWSQPPPTTSSLFNSSPQARSHVLCGWDSASNFRNQLNLYGGRAQDGQPLADFWYYDPTNHFWAQPNQFQPPNHPPNYGAVGGIDPTYLPAPPGTSNSFLFLGGANASHSSNTLVPNSLSIDGQLGSNTNTVNVNLTSLAAGLSASNPTSTNNLINGRWGASGTIMPHSKLVIFSGCNGDPSNEFRDKVDPSCSLTTGGILTFESAFAPSQMSTRSTPPQSSWAGFSYCPAPRVGGTMVPNRNQFDSSYANQVIMIGGRTDSKNWNDQGGAAAGEVAVLDISSGVWARVLPMRKDNATFTPKEGLLALALPTQVGAATSKSTDILVYGGIDVATGQASNELWILRLHPAKLTGNGTADGVTMAYMPSCVTPTPQNKNNNNTNNSGSPSGAADDGNPGTLQAPIGHLIFSAVALAIMMASLTMLRCEEPGKLSIRSRWRTSRLWLLIAAWHTLILSCALLALAVVIALFQTRILSIPANLSSSSSLTKRSLFTGDTVYTKLQPQETLSQSTHARLGLAIVIVGFIVVPILYLLSWLDDSLEARRKKNQLSSADAGPRKLKAKEAQGSGLTRRALERVVLLTRHPFASPKQQEQQQQQQHDVKRPSKETVMSRHDLVSVAEKHGEIVVERRLSVPTGDKRSPLSEGMDSQTTSRTSTQLLSQRSSSSAGSGRNGVQETTPRAARKPSPSKLKLDLKPVERPLVRSPFSKVFRNLPAGFLGRHASEPPPDGPSPAGGGGGGAPSSGFEVLNRRPPRQRPRPRASLDIMSDPGSPPRHSLDPPTAERRSVTAYEELARGEGYGSGDSDVAEEEVVEEEDEEEEEDEDDSVYKRRTKARRKMRRLADVALHLVVLLANIYFISSCFISQRELRWLGALALAINLALYSAILWLAWVGKPSSESTLVIFLSILKDGSKNLMANDALPGLGQFSSFQQQQQQAAQQQQQQQQQQQGMQPPSTAGGMGSSSVLGMGGKRSTTGSRFQAISLYGGSQPGAFYGGFYAAEQARAASPEPSDAASAPPQPQPSSLLLYDSHRLWASPPLPDHLLPDSPSLDLPLPRDSYLQDREIQIVTTAPKRKLAVVNH